MISQSGKPGESRLEALLDRSIRAGLVLIVVLAPLPFGAVEPWATSALELGVAAVALLFLYRLFLFPATTRIEFSPLLVPAVGILVLMGMQIIPLPERVIGALSPKTSELYRDALPRGSAPADDVSTAAAPTPGKAPDPWRPISQSSFATRTYLLKGVAFTLFLFLFLNAFHETRQVRLVLYALVAAGTFQAFYGVLEYVSGHQHIFLYQKKYYTDAATGTFINRNHYAAFLEMALLSALGLFLSRLREPHAGETWRERLLALTDRRASLNLALLLGIGIIAVGLVLSYSRAGIILGMVAAAAFCLFQLRRGWSLQKTVLVGVLSAAVLVPAYGVGYWTLTGRYSLLTTELTMPGGRMAVWKKTLGIVRDFPLTGTGVGTFQFVFPRYRDATTTAFYDYAHNDYLQVLSEAGLMGGILLALAVAVIGAAWIRRAAPMGSVLRSACGFGLLAVALHEMVDFSLQIPANLLAFTLLAGSLLVLGKTGGEPEEGVPRA
ncbi:MAG TPA: O-antigen ligase family protein [Candidatus Polarisedimenticolia bacterium]|nr:O-antigen ligase family protein [Candidatus Polarisedimenticolia bacterium]